ncbi:hypothetical protein ABMA27_009345 [Loxostege sticticalis]|uniref:Reverse transcriptase domain-containing protein n=1 Tax=Loxostege sticticalis TaxID=481309 RepID=A0ABR3H7N3_LOXSC
MSEPGEGDGDVSDADVTLSKNPAGQNPPLSEVGLPPTSARPTDSNNEIANTSVSGVPAEFFSQMLQMMKHVSDRLVTLPDSKVKINDVFLPSYDPDANIGVREWCQHVTTAMETYNLSDYDVRMKAGSLLKGRARLWVDNWLVSTTTWEELRDVLITTFEPENRYSRDAVRFREHNYDHSKDIAQFLSQAWVLWRRITKDKLSNDDAVEAVIGCIGDERLRIELLNCDLTDGDQICELKLLLNKFEHLFIRGYPRTRVNTGELEIRLKDPNKCVERRPYRLSPIEREKVRDIVNELLDHNIIRESKSPFSSPIILVKKKNGKDRMCVDYRELNRNTLRDHYPLPIISDQIDQLAGGLYFSTFDMAAGFHQIPISESSVEKTAFVTPDGMYEYLAMPFGLSNACSVYQRCMNRALAALLNSPDQVCQVYVDDVLSKCREFSEVMSTLKNALTMIKNYDTENWQTALEALQLAFNCTPHRITGVAPLTLLTRRQHCVPPELLRLVNIDSETIDFDTLDQHVQQKMTAAAQYEKLRFDRNKAKLRRPRKVAHDQLRRAPQPGEQETVSTGNNNNTQQYTTSQQGNDSSAAKVKQYQTGLLSEVLYSVMNLLWFL